MKRRLTLALLLLSAVSAFAQTPAATPAPDPKITTLGSDLHALARIADLSKNLPDSRQVLLAIIDANVESMRTRRDDGTYQWASLQREEAGRVSDEKTIERVSTEQELRYVTISAPNAYRVLVTVPPKRSLVSANNRVYIRNVIVDSTGFDGKTTHQEIPVNAWVNPGDANGTALPDIGKSVKATAELGVESGEKRAVAEVALIQAKLVDDPNSPYFPAIRRLLQIRDIAAAKEIQRGPLKSTIDEALLSLPGELDKRAAEQARALEDRKVANGTITPADASPDVVKAIEEVSRMLNGTLQEQSDARAKLQQLIETLHPPATPQ
ncbi:MAG TPA: hypothetical protein VMU84_01995 [Thermoanaerobaculia bacterium]|nr:hypothetical protein [Thermoanaerobaculia bacterium]